MGFSGSGGMAGRVIDLLIIQQRTLSCFDPCAAFFSRPFSFYDWGTTITCYILWSFSPSSSPLLLLFLVLDEIPALALEVADVGRAIEILLASRVGADADGDRQV